MEEKNISFYILFWSVCVARFFNIPILFLRLGYSSMAWIWAVAAGVSGCFLSFHKRWMLTVGGAYTYNIAGK